jgi:hypothetical protein
LSAPHGGIREPCGYHANPRRTATLNATGAHGSARRYSGCCTAATRAPSMRPRQLTRRASGQRAA